MRNIDADPFTFEILRSNDRRPAAAEWVKDNITFVTTYFDYSF